jgi:lipopolysaccharide transport system permease protein
MKARVIPDIGRTYEPDNLLKKGIFYVFTEILDELRKNIWLIQQMFKRDFSAMYRQSLIGIYWAFIIPLCSVGTFIILNRSGVFSIGKVSVPYPIFAISGMAFWQIFSIGLIASTNALANAGSMIVKINFSRKALVIAAWAQFVVPLLVQLLLVGMLFIGYGISPNLKILLVPLAIIPIMLLTLGFGLILSMLNAVLRDIGNAISVLITFLMFLTPVLYEGPATGMLAKVTKYNPLYYLINAPRDLMLFGEIAHFKGFLISALISPVLFLSFLRVFHIAEVRIIERV